MAHRRTQTRTDFLQCLETDICLYIMSFLDDPTDLVRASVVSRFWRHFVIANGLAKQLFLRKFPQHFSIACEYNASEVTVNSGVEIDNTTTWEIYERDNKAYASLLHAIAQSKVRPLDCITNVVSASSIDNYPNGNVVNTLYPKDRFSGIPSYWSSKGQRNPEVPETLVYKLSSGLWIIYGVLINPFEAFFQQGKPIYSARSVRFRMGHPKSPTELGNDLQHLSLHEPADDKFVWTYTSPEFPMMQENRLQPFKLPSPVLSVGGYLQVELSGRVQRQENDRLFYIRLCSVQVFGRPLFPAFEVDILELTQQISLEYYPEYLNTIMLDSARNEVIHLRQLKQQMVWERSDLLKHMWRLLRFQP